MNSDLIRRIFVTFAIIIVPLIIGLLFTYEIINFEFLSWMENQPYIRAMEMPFPVPEN